MQSKSDNQSSPLNPRQDLYEVYAHSEYSMKRKKKIIDALDDIDGFELAFLISYIMHLQLTGHLNIIASDNVVTGVSFNAGIITHIDLPDKQTYFGALLVQLGYVTQNELDLALKNANVHIGQYFIKLGRVTQQQVDYTFRQQMEQRLTKLIGDSTFNVNFSEADQTPIFIKIGKKDFFNLCYIWLETKFPTRWLSEHFKTWSERKVLFVDAIELLPDILKKPVFADLPGFDEQLRRAGTYQQLADLYRDKQEAFLRAMYLLALCGAVVFEKGSADKKSKLEEIGQRLEGKAGTALRKELAELTGVSESQNEAIYLAFSKLISEHGDDAPIEIKNRLVKISIEFLSLKNEAVRSNPTARNQVESKIIQNALLGVQSDLLKNEFFGAFGKLKKISMDASVVPSVKVYFLWAKVGHAYSSGVNVDVNTYEKEIESLSAQDKDSAELNYVKAMIAAIKNDTQSAERLFDVAVTKKPLFAQHPIRQTMLKKFLKFVGLKP